MSEKPKRAFRLTMMLDADTREDMVEALRRMADDVALDAITVGLYGSPTDSAIYELLHDPAMTHDAYHAALREYLSTAKEDET